MRVFVAGATGVIGQRAVRALVAAGHEVTAVVRSPAKAELARSLGATPVEVSIFDPDALRAAVAGHDAVVQPRDAHPAAGAGGDRERVGGEHAHPHRGIAQSRRRRARGRCDACTCRSRSRSSTASTATTWSTRRRTPIADTRFTEPVRAAEAERAALRRRRAAAASCCASACSSRPTAIRRSRWRAAARRGSRSIPGDADGYFPAIHADDAAAAVVAALDGADAAPTTSSTTSRSRAREQRAALARRGRPAPAVCRCRAPKKVVGPLGDSQRVSNAAVPGRRRTGRRAYRERCARAGRLTVRGGGHRTRARRGWVRLLLWLHGDRQRRRRRPGAVLRRGRSTTTSRSAGAGSRWTAPYNQHLVRDVGSLNLAIVVLVFAALFVSTRTLARVAASCTS